MLPPLQLTSVNEVEADNVTAGCVNVIVLLALHPASSVTVIEIFPAGRSDTSSVAAPFDQAKVYGEVPPLTERFIAPVESPRQ